MARDAKKAKAVGAEEDITRRRCGHCGKWFEATEEWLSKQQAQCQSRHRKERIEQQEHLLVLEIQTAQKAAIPLATQPVGKD